MDNDQILKNKIKQDDQIIFTLLSNYLNRAPDFITADDIDDLVETGVSKEYAFRTILAIAFGLEIVDNQRDKELFYNYFHKMIHQLDLTTYTNDKYYQNIKIPKKKLGNIELKYEHFKPYEGFVFDDIILQEDGRQIPQIGFFRKHLNFQRF